MSRGFFQNWTTDDDGNFVRVGLTKDETFEYQVHCLNELNLGVLGGNSQRTVNVAGVWTRAQFPLLESKEGKLQRQPPHGELREKDLRART